MTQQSDTVKRYEPAAYDGTGTYMQETGEHDWPGGWVRYEDYAALRKELEGVREQLKQIKVIALTRNIGEERNWAEQRIWEIESALPHVSEKER